MAEVTSDNRLFVVDTDAQGDLVPSVGAMARFFDAQTTTVREVYVDPDFVTPLQQPLVTDAAGYTPQYFIDPTGGKFKLRVSDANDALVYEDDLLSPPLSLPVGIANGGTGVTTASAALSALGGAPVATTNSHNTRITTLEGKEAAAKLVRWNDQTWASSFTADFSGKEGVAVTVAGDTTFNAPSNLVPDQTAYLEITQDGTGSRVPTFNAAWNIPPNTEFSRAAGKVDKIIGVATSASEFQPYGIIIADAPYTDYTMQNPYATAGNIVQAHGLRNSKPKVEVYLECITDDAGPGYVVGDILWNGSAVQTTDTGFRRGITAAANATNIIVRTGATTFQVITASGTASGITAANWKTMARVWRD